MGCCQSDDYTGLEEEPTSRPQKKTITFNLQSPAEHEFHIQHASKISMEVTAADKGRTMDIEFFDEAGKAKFDSNFGALGGRAHSAHQLSIQKWKTNDKLVRDASVPPGTYFIVARSSSVLKDKEVHLTFKLTLERQK